MFDVIAQNKNYTFHVWDRGTYWWENLKERTHLGYLGVDGITILKWILKKSVGKAQTGFIWMAIWTGGGVL